MLATASGCGKTTVGRALAERLDVPFTELDALVHGPNWTETPDDVLRAQVAAIVAFEGWVVDGSYSRKLGTLVLDAADTVVWLDLPVRVWFPRLVRRTARRVRGRERLWNDNRETLLGAVWGRESLFVCAFRSLPPSPSVPERTRPLQPRPPALAGRVDSLAPPPSASAASATSGRPAAAVASRPESVSSMPTKYRPELAMGLARRAQAASRARRGRRDGRRGLQTGPEARRRDHGVRWIRSPPASTTSSRRATRPPRRSRPHPSAPRRRCPRRESGSSRCAAAA